MYAIALTLLVLDLRLPRMSGDPDSPGSMLAALNDLTPKLVSFGVAFILLARYWMANHTFFTRIGRFDRRYAFITPTIMLMSWLVMGPLLGRLANRRRPAGAFYD